MSRKLFLPASVALLMAPAVRAEEPTPFRAREPSVARAEQPRRARAEEPKPVQAQEPRAFQAEEPKPIQAQEPRAFQAEEPRPVRADPATTDGPGRSSGEPKAFVAEEVKPLPPAGVDPAPSPKPVGPELIGRWAVSVPSASWTTRTYDGATAVDTTRSGVGASFGELTVDKAGHYLWKRKGRVIGKGRLEQVIPRRDANPDARYYALTRDGERLYLTAAADGLYVYTVASNSFTAVGRRVR